MDPIGVEQLQCRADHAEHDVVGAIAGIGFTMALFVAELAFAGRAELYGSAKLVVLLSSAAAAAAGLVLGRVLLRRNPAEAGVRSQRDRSRFVPELERGPLAYVLLATPRQVSPAGKDASRMVRAASRRRYRA